MDADNPIVRLCIAAHYVARNQPTAHDTGGLVRRGIAEGRRRVGPA